MTTPNTPELIAIYQHIKANPKGWKQNFWATRTDCGTAYCFAGHAVMRAGMPLDESSGFVIEGVKRYDMVLINNESRHIEHIARELLGLDRDESDRLFQASNTLDEIQKIVFDLTGVDPELAVPLTVEPVLAMA